MGSTPIDTRRVRTGLARLAENDGRPARGDHRIYKIKVVSKSGKKASVVVALDTGPKQQTGDVLDMLADQLHVAEGDLADVLANWSCERFRAHCAALSDDALKPPSMRKRFS